MNAFEIKAWVGSNPLHMLAGLGALLLTDDAEPGAAKMSWRRGKTGWSPVIHTAMTQDAWAENLVSRLRAAGEVKADDEQRRAISRVRNDAKKVLKDAEERLKKRTKEVKDLAKKESVAKAELDAWMETRNAPERKAVDEATRVFAEAQAGLADGLGVGPAHLGDLVGVEVGVFRSKAEAALRAPMERTLVRQLGALASDGCTEKGCVQPTPFSFGNGSSAQFLLKDFRVLSQLVDSSMAEACLAGSPVLADQTSLNWDPAGQKSYALQWGDPASAEKHIDVLANAAAFMGLGFLTAVPRNRNVSAVGFKRPYWTWPIWEPALDVAVIQSLLGMRELSEEGGPARLRRRGVLEVLRAERINVNKRFYFAPARSV